MTLFLIKGNNVSDTDNVLCQVHMALLLCFPSCFLHIEIVEQVGFADFKFEKIEIFLYLAHHI